MTQVQLAEQHRTHMHGAIRWLVLSTTIAFAASVWAQGTPSQGWSLHWHAPASCPSESAVRAEVRSLLEDSTRSDVTLAVTGNTQEANDGFEVELRFASAEGPAQRVLNGRDCQEVAKAAALVIALAIDPGVKINPNRQSALEAPTETPEEAPPAPPTRTATNVEPAKPKPPPPLAADPQPISFEAVAAGVLEVGTLPDVALGARVAASLGVGPWRATLAGDFFPPRIYDADQGTRLRLSVPTGALLVGYAISLDGSANRGHTLTPEIGLRLGNLSASARDADSPGSANSVLFGPQGGLRATLPLVGPLGVSLGLHSGVHLQRPRLVVENRGVAHQPDRVWASGVLGISLRWP